MLGSGPVEGGGGRKKGVLSSHLLWAQGSASKSINPDPVTENCRNQNWVGLD